ncbi:MAG: calcium/sodium antiporter [Spirochaetales bacterium]|uniref:Calcium/sodium antiporter n=1 Tax=Candidatus Thalassospirochaeta sargassi TaxID=3119039 RepID=A0AAJ1IJ79_9SPIO|nr:calcium/sodium antiporter [Spirochaetales bacterium]
MEEIIVSLVEGLPIVVLFVIIFAVLYTLGKGADLLVDEAVTLSMKWGIPKVLIGATVVSLGTTLPEASVSVMAAVRGNPDLALGNAVGSIICDTGLIVGIAALISPLALNKKLVNRQGWLQFGSGVLLVLFSILAGASIPQYAGFTFVILLVCYMIITVRWSKDSDELPSEELDHADQGPMIVVLLKLIIGITLIIVSSKILIPTVEITAIRIGIPESIIAATLVAFGTSLPELVTAISAARRGHGDLAIGNIIGADILNVLFVVGAAASVTPQGLPIPPYFFGLQFPVMIGILLTFRLITLFAKTEVKRWHGLLLLSMYIGYTVFSYISV